MDEHRGSPVSPDGMLAASARAGDFDAFAELYHRYVRHVYDFLLRSLHDPAVAAELTQSTFVRAHGRIESLRDPDRVREWLFGLAYRLVVGQLRRGPVPAAREPMPRHAGPLRAGGGSGVGEVDGADLVWEAAATLPPGLYAVLDVTARQGLDVSELAADAGISREDAMAQLERAHDAYGRAVRDLLVSRSSDWCPGLASLVQTAGAGAEGGEPAQDDSVRVDDHLGRCPRCRPIAERLMAPATLSQTPLFELEPGLARDGWDRLVEQLVRASPRATRAALHQPEPAREDTAQLVTGEAVEYFAFPVPDQVAAPAVVGETTIARHESVRRYRARAERAHFRTTAAWAAIVAVLVVAAVAIALAGTHHGPPAAVTTTTATTVPSTQHTTTTRRSSSTTSTLRATTTTKVTTTTAKASTTTTVPVPQVTSMAPGDGDPGTTVVLGGMNFVPGDLVAFTGPTLPGGTEELSPLSLTSASITAAVPSLYAYAGQQILVAVRNKAGVSSVTEQFLVLTYHSGDWTKSGGKVDLSPTKLSYGSTQDGTVQTFATDVESEQCLVNDSLTVYLSTVSRQPVAVATKTSTCAAEEYTITPA